MVVSSRQLGSFREWFRVRYLVVSAYNGLTTVAQETFTSLPHNVRCSGTRPALDWSL